MSYRKSVMFLKFKIVMELNHLFDNINKELSENRSNSQVYLYILKQDWYKDTLSPTYQFNGEE
jgi:hypothetical protein